MSHEVYMQRCLELAQKAAGHVAPNPMVGAVLVNDGHIIGEGYHQVYGGPHAEVNCIDSVPAELKHLIADSTLYVSLEPCAHHGKTPPCADLIIRNNIRHVVVGCRDPFVEVDGKGIEKLRAAGIKTEIGILERECKELNRRFLTFHTQHRPYIVLKWAETADGKMGDPSSDRLHITGSITNKLVHKWRSEEASIFVGANTALLDDPQLTNRLWSGPSPVRMVLDPNLRLPPHLHLFDGTTRTIVFNSIKHEEQGNIVFYQVSNDTSIVHQVIHALYQLRLLSVIVEGGARLLQSFIDDGSWDEARVITNSVLRIAAGINSPVLAHEKLVHQETIEKDIIRYYIKD